MPNRFIIPHEHSVTHADRSAIKGHRPAVLWFTGLSGSGKSTIANAVDAALNASFKAHTFLLDGDNIRSGLNNDLGFSNEDRVENIRRIGEVTRLFYDAGLIVLTAFISPFQADRDAVRARIPDGRFIEVFVDCPLDICETRDPKGLYRKARAGEIPQFTGVSSPYEAPTNPEITVNSGTQSVENCARTILSYLDAHGIIDQD